MRLLVRIVLASCICLDITSAFYKYKSSYAFLNVQSKKVPQDSGNARFCINFQQWRERDLPPSLYEALHFRLDWWGVTENDTDICTQRIGKDFNFIQNSIVPMNYETDKAEIFKKCGNQSEFNLLQPIGSLVKIMKQGGVKNILFLMEKGKYNFYQMHNYLFTHFYNSEINESSINIFYLYDDVFWHQILPLMDTITPISPSNVNQLRIFQPQTSWPMDPAVIVLWFIAFLCIFIGSLWAAADTRAKLGGERRKIDGDGSRAGLTIENGEQRLPGLHLNMDSSSSKNQVKRSESAEIARMSACQHCSYVSVAVFIVVIILMLGFFFREYAVYFFNFFLLLIGTISMHSCLYAILQWAIGGWDFPLCTFRQLCCGFRFPGRYQPSSRMDESSSAHRHALNERQPDSINNTVASSVSSPQSMNKSESNTLTPAETVNTSFLDHQINLLSALIYIFALSFCLLWFFMRRRYYAYLLLDPINVCLCVFTIRAGRIHTLRLITFLLLAMFVYDLFMVFGTRFLTSDGCSVMMQVVTGTDCRPNGGTNSTAINFQPVPPIDVNYIPEKLPLLFYVPMLADPMAECYDIEVEREYKNVLLGLGDVIVPGYLVAYCFYIDVVKGNNYHTYGIVAIIGYSLGMVCTFVAMLVMETGQPALIYLVPCTLIPVCLWALFADTRGTLGKMWHGKI